MDMLNIAELSSLYPKRSIFRFFECRWSMIFILCIFLAYLLCLGVFRTQSTVFDEAIWESSQRLKAVIFYFSKELHLTCLTGFWIRLCIFDVNFLWQFIKNLLCLGAFRTQSTVFDEAIWENSQRLKAVIYFSKELHLTCLAGFCIRLCIFNVNFLWVI